jgi:hypothetical protein
LEETFKWLHQVTGHPGEKHLCETLQQHYYHSSSNVSLTSSGVSIAHDTSCQEKDADCYRSGRCGQPWEEVTINFIGPWMVKVNNSKVEFNALNSMDTASNLVELIRIDNKTPQHIQDKFIQSWLFHYPRPIHCIHDKGSKFIGGTSQCLLHSFDQGYSINS